MTMTAASLKTLHPEFANAADALVTQAITDAEAELSSDVWGDSHDTGVRLAACHSLALSPFAQEMKLIAKDGESLYSRRLRALKVAKVCGLGRVA